jgi:branched-chain amino acid transport system substrate-binding protein
MPQISMPSALGVAVILALWTQTASAQIKIGVSIPLTGPLAVFGQAVSSGARLAVDTINAQGGLNGTHLELIQKDVDCRPGLGANSAGELIDRDHVSALMGYPCTGASLEASRVAAEKDILLLTLSASAPVSGDRRTVLRLIGPDVSMAQTTADYVANNFQNKRIGTWLANPSPQFNAALNSDLLAHGIKTVQTQDGPGQEPPGWVNDVDVLLASPATPSIAVTALAKNFPKTTVVVSAPIISPNLAENLRRPNLAVISNPAPDFFPGATEVARRAGYPQPLSSTYAIYAYAAVQVFAATARKTNWNFSGTALVTAAKAQPIPTAIGQLQYDDRGEIKNWKFAIYVESSDPNVCKSPECKNYQQCLPCPN